MIFLFLKTELKIIKSKATVKSKIATPPLLMQGQVITIHKDT